MDREELCESLIIWMNTFNLQSKATSIGDLTDGVLMMQALHQIAPAHFTESWMSKIKADVGNNWRLKVNNLKKILKGILDFYSEVLGQQIHDFHMPDIQSIGEHNDGVELGRLLQLILGCAVNCEEKQEYIQRIMSMEESVQHSVMRAIQELMTKEVPSASSDSSDSSQQLKKTLEELNKVVGEKEELAQRCHELDQQVSGLLEEKTNLEKENESLSERINQSDSLDDPSKWDDWPEFILSTPAGRRYQMLQAQVEQFQDEMFRLEAARDDYRIKVELQEKEILDLQTKNEDLTKLAEEARAVKDEIEILRFTSDKVAKYEATIESYKKKMEELSDLKGQIKILEEKNTSYMETNMELEEEIRKAGSVKSQLEMYKRQAQELQMKSGEETKRADKAEFDAKRQQEKIQTLQQEKQRLAEERDSLKEAIDNLEGTRAQEGVLGDGVDLDSSGMVDLMTVPPEVKEKLIRLQHENKMLKLQRSENDDENSQLLQTMLEDANSRKNELESEVRILNQRTMELQAQIEDLQENQQKADDKSGSDLRNKLKETNEKYRVLEKDLQTLRNKCEEQESDNLSHVRKMKLLEDELKKKDDEMKVMEEKYKRYLEKARSVINTLDPKYNSSNSGVEVQALRNQLQEKERLIEHLERDHEKSKNIREHEEKLMVTAWYNMGMHLQKKAAEERLTNNGVGQSFLSRQRQAHNNRRTQSVTNNSPHLQNISGSR